jgi:hypothetical protein
MAEIAESLKQGLAEVRPRLARVDQSTSNLLEQIQRARLASVLWPSQSFGSGPLLPTSGPLLEHLSWDLKILAGVGGRV